MQGRPALRHGTGEKLTHTKHLKSHIRESTLSLILSVSLELLQLWVLCISEVLLASGLPGPTCPQEASECHSPKQTPRGALPTRVRALVLLSELPTARPVWTARVAFVSMATAEVPTCIIQRGRQQKVESSSTKLSLATFSLKHSDLPEGLPSPAHCHENHPVARLGQARLSELSKMQPGDELVCTSTAKYWFAS